MLVAERLRTDDHEPRLFSPPSCPAFNLDNVERFSLAGAVPPREGSRPAPPSEKRSTLSRLKAGPSGGLKEALMIPLPPKTLATSIALLDGDGIPETARRG